MSDIQEVHWCKVCKKDFYTNCINVETCSDECEKKLHQNIKIKKIEKNCIYCKQRFRVLTFRQCFCSEECKKLYRKLNYKPKEKINKICKYCNKEYKTIWTRQMFCCKTCQYRWYKIYYFNLNNKTSKKMDYLKTRFEIFKKDNFTCQYCGRNVKEDKIRLHIEHIIPKAKGGTDDPSNLTTSCSDCNFGKSDRMLECHHLK